ncbi:hypothetical protein COV53_05460 [Candidatus Gottesmanbacteria bacterium CG11_big_fil_rev_8_21_14_0_20_37_11]|uniref:Glycosyl transferase family 1 domain-containing protein n=1 Tax=Candidatus Gottesmanbacteria bacterium CG11_big_fil_rev_8_21_14_0_20_37_11 TaxID=1974575 RepID=A0A2H0NGG5_9BACT|nr:MAG: hypothetical protein COV53_05460 [Candidatus Gottesmanbacteria bacterium CG11_big_fil_rev_8_21_14_0_20_37_11]
MKKLIQQYNHQDNLIVISLYPKRGEIYSAGISGVASYAKNVAKNMNRKVVVLADILGKKELYEEENVLVYRCFKGNTPFMWITLVKTLLQFPSIKNILIQLDFAVYGGIRTTACVLPFLAVLKILGYKTSVTMHHVVLDVFKLKGHVGLGDGILDTLKGFVYNVIFHLFYFFLGLLAKQIIVLEEVLKNKLSRLTSENKIITISHGVDDKLQSISKDIARKRLGIGKREYAVLFFGFINWFKGADCFVDSYKTTGKFLGRKARFILAGGKSPTMKDKPFYQKFYKEVTDNIKTSKRIEMTGYVPQNKIASYFSACDLVVLPYRHLMTASGVLSLVFSYRKPFIVSENLGEMFQSPDLSEAMKYAGLKTSDLVFKLDRKSCLSVTENVLADGLKPKMVKMAEIVRDKRSYSNIALLYEKALFAPVLTISKKVALSYAKG